MGVVVKEKFAVDEYFYISSVLLCSVVKMMIMALLSDF